MTSFPVMAGRRAETPTLADLVAPAKIILPEIEWRKRPVRKGGPLDGDEASQAIGDGGKPSR